MKKTKIIIALIIISIIGISIFVIYNLNNNIEVKEDYYLKLIGGAGEIMNTTYLYWDGGQEAEYVCSRSVTKSWGSDEWDETPTKKGKLQFVQGIYDIAKENHSFGYVIINRDIQLEKNNINYKKGDMLTIEQLYELFNVIGPK